jgi:hypothetical protein
VNPRGVLNIGRSPHDAELRSQPLGLVYPPESTSASRVQRVACRSPDALCHLLSSVRVPPPGLWQLPVATWRKNAFSDQFPNWGLLSKGSGQPLARCRSSRNSHSGRCLGASQWSRDPYVRENCADPSSRWKRPANAPPGRHAIATDGDDAKSVCGEHSRLSGKAGQLAIWYQSPLLLPSRSPESGQIPM